MTEETIPIEDQRFEELVELIKDKEDMDLDRVRRAYEFGKKAHEGQFRMSGEPYICHPVEAAKILAELGACEESTIAALLHDVPEDTKYTVKDIEKKFGKKISRLVDALTKLSKVYFKHSMNDRQVESLRKLFLETANNPKVVIVKLADRLHNMKTLHYLRPDKQQRIARETLKIYAPLANLFGIYQLRRQLEDLCFKYLQPEEYARIDAFVQDHEKKRNHYIDDMINVLNKTFKNTDINVKFYGRPKHFYSIYKKVLKDNKKLSEIHDYFAIRVITQSREDCYRALNIVHQTFKPKPHRFKDYISVPKMNGYQSLHTTVVGLRGYPTEIQIRTEEMHNNAEYGSASHLLYKEGGLSKFLSDNVNLLNEAKDSQNFISKLEEDLLRNKIFVFSVEGDVVNLPEGSTCLDYIYAIDAPIHEKVCRPVVNGQAYSIVGELQSGDHVDVIVNKNSSRGPQRWWMDHVKTTLAKNRLQEYFSKQSFGERVELGRALLQQELDHEQQALIHQLPADLIEDLLDAYGEPDMATLLSKIGEGQYSEKDVYRFMFPELKVPLTMKLRRRLARVFAKLELGQRFNIGEGYDKYRIHVELHAYDRVGLLREVAEVCYTMNIPIIRYIGRGFDTKRNPIRQLPSGVRIRMNEEQISRTNLIVHIENHEELITLFDHFEKIPGMIRIQRVFRRKQILFYLFALFVFGYVLGHPYLLKCIHDRYLFDQEYISDVWIFIGMYSAIMMVFILLLLLRSMGNKTFPHFEETKFFWPLTFGISLFLIAVQFVNDHVFDLHLHTPVLISLSVFGLVFLWLSYRSHRRRKASLLHRMEAK